MKTQDEIPQHTAAKPALLRLQDWLAANTVNEWTMVSMWGATQGIGKDKKTVFFVSLRDEGVEGDTLASAVNAALYRDALEIATQAAERAHATRAAEQEAASAIAQQQALDAEQERLRAAAAQSASAFWAEYLRRTEGDDERERAGGAPLTLAECHAVLHDLAKEWTLEGATSAQPQDELPV